MDEDKLTTVGELRRELEGWDDDTPLFFGGGSSNTLTFYRIKNRGDREGKKPLLQIEFNELFEVKDLA